MPFPEFLQTIIEMLSLSTFYSNAKMNAKIAEFGSYRYKSYVSMCLVILIPSRIGVTRAPCVLQSNIRAAENGVVVVDGRC